MKINCIMKNYFLILFVLITFWGCSKKTVPSQIVGDVSFLFDGTIGNEPVLLEAGKNGIYMNSDYYIDDQELITLRSQLSQQACTSCDSFLSFELKDIDVNKNGKLAQGILGILTQSHFDSFSLDSVLTSSNSEVFNFNSTFAQGNHTWHFGDGSIATGANVTHAYPNGGGLKKIKHIVSLQGITDSVENEINTDSGSTCRPHFSIQTDTTNIVTVTASNLNLNNQLWDFGNGATNSGVTSNVIYNSGIVYTITLTTSSPTCSTMTYRAKVNMSSNLSYPIPNFDYDATSAISNFNLPRINKSAFIITWHKNGKTYKSYKNVYGISQVGDPLFTFKGYSDYVETKAGLPTKKIEGSIDTWLYNQDNANDSIKIKSNRLVIAASYPQ
jgi:hypothetical protein